METEKSMKIMVTGAGGFVGSRLVAYYGKKYDAWGVTHKDLDLTDEAAVFKTVEKYRPDVLLHCAAVSDVAECSKKPELSHAVNVLGTEYLAKACGKTGTKLVMCSSDQVYFRKRGEQESLDAYLEPHWEDCIETPEPLYGKQKLQGEELCLKYQPESVVLRLSWMYDSLTEDELAKGRRNLATMLREMLDQKQSRKFSDTDHRGVTDVTLVVKNMEAAWKLPGGIYNYGSSNDTNMYETVRRVMASFGQEALAEKATGGKIKVNVYAADQLTNGNQSEGIQALIDGDPVQISMHSNLIYSAFDPRFNVVSLPFLFDSVEDADAKLDGEAGQKMDEILSSYDLHCMGMAENGFRQLTNGVRPVRSVEDMKNLKLRVAGSNLLMKCYELWGADATNMNWSETYTALQQGTVDGQENPLPAIDAASVQEVQKYVSMWNANYDCLFFCINQDIYDSLTPEQQEVVDECGKLAVQYEREINRAGDDEILSRWQSKNGVEVIPYEDLDIDSFKAIVEPVTEWYIGELKKQGYKDAEELVAAFK